MATKKKTTTETPAVEEVKEEVKKTKAVKEEPVLTDEIKEDIAVVDESTETEEKNDDLKKSISKLVDSVSEAVKSAPIKQETSTPATKKPFKLGFWGYLGLAVVAKATVEIVRVIANSKKPRR